MKKLTTIILTWLIISGNIYGQNVGIGISDPLVKLHIKQDVQNRAIQWQHNITSDSWTLGIGLNTLNCRFEFNGILRGQISSVDGSFITGSDIRLKENIEPLTPSLVKLMQLKPCTYFYSSSHSNAKNKSIGFIAQEVKNIFPEMVYDMDNGYIGLNYSGFAVIAIKAIQEQQKNIEAQKQEIDEQKKIISNLEERLQKMDNTLSSLITKNRL